MDPRADAADLADLNVSSADGTLACEVILGYSFRNTSSSTAGTVNIHRGTTAAGPLIATVSLAASESTDRWWGDRGIKTDGSSYIDVPAGNIITGTVRVIQ